MIEENIRRKIQELINRGPPLAPTPTGLARDNQHSSQCQGWLAEALNVVELAIPIPENAYRRTLTKIAEGSRSAPQRVSVVAAMLDAILRDIDSGLLADLANKIRAETFDSFLDHAEAYREKGRKNEAGVIAGVVFEDTVRRICRERGIKEKGQSLEDMINTLARRDVITGQQSKQAKVGAHVRTKATHAQWDDFDLAGVEATIQFTRVLHRDHLGG